jgi:hypothetical protein
MHRLGLNPQRLALSHNGKANGDAYPAQFTLAASRPRPTYGELELWHNEIERQAG